MSRTDLQALARIDRRLCGIPLSARQVRVLEFIRKRIRAGREFPTDAEILEVAPTHHRISGVQGTLLALESRGLIARQETRWTRRGNRIVSKWSLIEEEPT